VGAIDGTHIPIIAPHEHHADYYNRKCHHSVIMQAVVDYNYRFINIDVGHVGKHHDTHVLWESSLYLKAGSGDLLPRRTEYIDNTEVPVFLIGDPAIIGIWVPSMAPQHCGNPQRVRNPSTTLLRDCPVGNFKYFGKNTVCIALIVSLYLKACSGDLLPRWTEYIDNTEVPLFLIGDPAYPLLPWLMKAYPGNNLTEE
jgi:hypothetical protein